MTLSIIIIENNIQSLQRPMKLEMDKAIKHFETELVKIRTGRANSALMDNLLVSCYNQPAIPLKQVAAIATPESRLLTIQPWDTNIIKDIEKAILQSDIGINPINDGKIIRLQFPQMSGSRREDLLKILGKKCEESKVAIRNVRKLFNNLIKDAKKNKTISENFYNRLTDILAKTTELFIKKTDDMSKHKKDEVTTI